MQLHAFYGIGIIVLFLLASAVIHAEEGNVIQPFVYSELIHDDNLFRLSGDNEALNLLGNVNRADTLYSLGTGIDIDLPLSQQQLIINGFINRNKYDRFGFLDYTGGEGNAILKWRANNILTGRTGYEYARSLSNFSHFQSAVRDIRTTQQAYVEAEQGLLNRLFLALKGNWKDFAFNEREQNDRRTLGGLIGVYYRGYEHNKVGAEANYIDGKFPNRVVNFENSIDTGYTRIELNAVFGWQVTGLTKLTLRAGYTNRKQDNIGADDFDGPTGKLDLEWSPTGGTTFIFSTWRSLSALDGEVANFVVLEGVKLQPIWKVTNKITANLGVGYESRDFVGGAVVDEDRKDEVFSANIGLEYELSRSLTFSLGYEHENRDSSRELSEYQFNKVIANARFSLNL